jgi:hypothetical protein
VTTTIVDVSPPCITFPPGKETASGGRREGPSSSET